MAELPAQRRLMLCGLAMKCHWQIVKMAVHCLDENSWDLKLDNVSVDRCLLVLFGSISVPLVPC